MMICPMTNSGCSYTAQCIGTCRHLPTDNGVASRIASLERDLAAAQAERDDANEECGYRINERDEARAEAAALLAVLVQLANDIHYPVCWDTAAYPKLIDALHEIITGAPCSTCAAIDQARGAAHD